eukprot:gnl/MRDRNA2_/MRDRNA2_99757_c0_seq1.p1 gnl/MRDRNA2_/MRDRNA2_99757_c0~~gnl/MRDRNA2_/MRDRNA2_99757_c0_seq1.p1  ORF type:complete len:774 (+),score=162.50 gnl/MRDRNA2_/MRDRNA2_99757_c0_seq1:174-2495(+)
MTGVNFGSAVAEATGQKKTVCLLTGFLGAGKTTLLRGLVKDPGSKKWALVVNDMAALNVDAALVQGEGTGDVLHLTNGCICCTLKDDLVSTVEKLAKMPEFDMVIVEASGMAEPQPIRLAFQQSSIVNLMVISVVDAGVYLQDLAAGSEVQVGTDARLRDDGASSKDRRGLAQLLANQTEGADVIVVNKIDKVDNKKREATAQGVRSLNDTAQIFQTSFGKGVELINLVDVWRAGPVRQADAGAIAAMPMIGSLGSFVWTSDRPFNAERLHALIKSFNTKVVLRSKGFLMYHSSTKGGLVGAYWSHAGGTLRLEIMPDIEKKERKRPDAPAAATADGKMHFDNGKQSIHDGLPPRCEQTVPGDVRYFVNGKLTPLPTTQAQDAKAVSPGSVQPATKVQLTEIVFIGFTMHNYYGAIDKKLRMCLMTDEEMRDPTKASADPIQLLPPSWTELGVAQGKAQRVWKRVALALAFFTVAWNFTEGIVSIRFGVEEESLALVGFGADSFVEVFSAMMVLFRLSKEASSQSIKQADKEKQLETERLTSRGVGGLLFVLGLLAILSGVIRLADESYPDSSLPNIIIASVSLSFMFILWGMKMRAARTLSSATLRSDAACSFDCIKLSVVLLVGGLLFALDDAFWWIDSVAAILLGVFIFKEGYTIVKNSLSPDFDGTAACCEEGGFSDRLYECMERCVGVKPVTGAGINSDAEVGVLGEEWTWNGNLAASSTVLFEDMPLHINGKSITLHNQEKVCVSGKCEGPCQTPETCVPVVKAASC